MSAWTKIGMAAVVLGTVAGRATPAAPAGIAQAEGRRAAQAAMP